MSDAEAPKLRIGPGVAAGVDEPLIERLVHAFYGRARQDPDHGLGEQDREEDDKQTDGGRGQLADEATPENHDAGKSFDFFGEICL